MLCKVLGRKLTAEERFATQALTADPSVLDTDHKESPPTCECLLYIVHLQIVFNIYTASKIREPKHCSHYEQMFSESPNNVIYLGIKKFHVIVFRTYITLCHACSKVFDVRY